MIVCQPLFQGLIGTGHEWCHIKMLSEQRGNQTTWNGYHRVGKTKSEEIVATENCRWRTKSAMNKQNSISKRRSTRTGLVGRQRKIDRSVGMRGQPRKETCMPNIDRRATNVLV